MPGDDNFRLFALVSGPSDPSAVHVVLLCVWPLLFEVDAVRPTCAELVVVGSLLEVAGVFAWTGVKVPFDCTPRECSGLVLPGTGVARTRDAGVDARGACVIGGKGAKDVFEVTAVT